MQLLAMLMLFLPMVQYFPLVVSTNNVGASAEDSVVLDVLQLLYLLHLFQLKVMMPLLFVLL